MLKRFQIFILSFIIFCVPFWQITYADEKEELELYAMSAVLIDASNNRVLYGKDENKVMAMASTTKIMTLIIALEYGDMEDVVTFSKYAASQPDVQLNAVAGEQYYLKDLLYAMMLKSYNDVAAAIAEYAGQTALGEEIDSEEVKVRDTSKSQEYIQAFAKLMNEKARELGCENTYFITPNGLDAEDENGKHSTTAYEMAIIAAYAISDERVTDITTTRNHSFAEINGKRTAAVATTDRFLDMMEGSLGLKTGFTGDAGYCFVGAVRMDGREFVSVVLGSGWPPNKSYKWTDTKKLMNYGISGYFEQTVLCPSKSYKKILVTDGIETEVDTYIPFSLEMLLSESDKVKVLYNIKEELKAPIKKNTQVGSVEIYINDRLYKSYPILTSNDVKEKNYWWFLRKVFEGLI